MRKCQCIQMTKEDTCTNSERKPVIQPVVDMMCFQVVYRFAEKIRGEADFYGNLVGKDFFSCFGV